MYCHGCWKGGEMSPKEIIERCNNMIVRLEYEAYGEQNSEAIKDIEALDEVISVLEKQEADRWIPVTEKGEFDGSI